jgi:hypothetical protein
MNLPDFYHLEVEGISETIQSYTVEHYIKSYSKQLISLNIEKDQERLLEWYEENIELINRSRFVSNKEEHQKSYRLLIELQEKLDS